MPLDHIDRNGLICEHSKFSMNSTGLVLELGTDLAPFTTTVCILININIFYLTFEVQTPTAEVVFHCSMQWITGSYTAQLDIVILKLFIIFLAQEFTDM